MSEERQKRRLSAIAAVAVAVTVMVAIFKTAIVIPAGTIGVVETFSKVSEKPLNPGIHLINPLAKVVKFSTRLQDIKETIGTTSKEGLNMNMDVSLQYRLNPQKVGNLYQNIGDNEGEIVISRFRSLVRQVTATYDLKSVYGQDRQKVAQRLRQELNDDLEPLGIVVEEVLLRNIVLPERIQAAIQEKLAAEQESEKLDFELEKAKKEAERKKIEARGNAEAQRLLSQGLTEQVLKLKAIEATQKLAESSEQ
jgi:regulator of protease activity HflC (stomatin/prohibitin superfamily)